MDYGLKVYKTIRLLEIQVIFIHLLQIESLVYNNKRNFAKMKQFLLKIVKSFLALEKGFKFYILITLSFLILEMFTNGLYESLVCTPTSVVQKFQYWRLFSSFLVNGELYFVNILNLLVHVFFLNIAMRQLQKKYFTLYIIVEIIKQNFIINLLLTIIYYPLIIYDIVLSNSITSYGMLITTVNFTFQMGFRNKDKMFSLYCLELKSIYLPLIMLITMTIFLANSTLLLTFGSVFIICLIQHSLLKTPLLSLPLGFYQTIEKVLPNFLVSARGYVSVGQCECQQQICRVWCKQNQQQKAETSNNSKFQQHWKQKQFDPPAQSNKIKQNDKSSNQIQLNQIKVQEKNETDFNCDLAVSEVIQHKQINYRSHWESKYSPQENNEVAHSAHNYNTLAEDLTLDIPNQQSEQVFEQFVGDSGHQSSNNEEKLQNRKQAKKNNLSRDLKKIAPAEDQQQWY